MTYNAKDPTWVNRMGKIFQSMADAEPERSPLQKMIDRLIFVLAVLCIAAPALNAAVCIPTGRGVEPNPTDPQALVCVFISIALTVAAVPENFPVALVIQDPPRDDVEHNIEIILGAGVVVSIHSLNKYEYDPNDKTKQNVCSISRVEAISEMDRDPFPYRGE